MSTGINIVMVDLLLDRVSVPVEYIEMLYRCVHLSFFIHKIFMFLLCSLYIDQMVRDDG